MSAQIVTRPVPQTDGTVRMVTGPMPRPDKLRKERRALERIRGLDHGALTPADGQNWWAW